MEIRSKKINYHDSNQTDKILRLIKETLTFPKTTLLSAEVTITRWIPLHAPVLPYIPA
jgi:hypothetical protein